MAKCVYVNDIQGDDSWDGLARSYVSGTNGPKKTIPGGKAVTVNGDLVLIAPGVYFSGYLYFNDGSRDNGTMYRRDPALPGRVIIDFQNASGTFWDTYWQYPTYFLDLHFRNPAASGYLFRCSDGNSRFYHCVFYNRTSGVTDTRGLQKFNSGGNDIALINCSFHNLTYGVVDLTLNPGYGNYFVNVTTPLYSIAGTRDYNAFPGNTGEANGINTTTGANPGFTDPAKGDFSLDPITTPADWQTFMTGGLNGGRVGAVSRGGAYYSHELPQLRFLSAAPTPAQGNPNLSWENEGPNGTNTYTAGTPGDIIESGSFGLEIDLVTTPAATGGRIRSDVLDMGSTAAIIRGLAYQSAETPATGEALDIDTTLPFQQEYRSSATPFAKGDGTPTWTPYSRSTNISQTGHCYAQYRVTFQTGHTNA